jgi:response regulator NasT
MNRILLASGSEKAGEVITNLLKQLNFENILTTNNSQDIYKLVKNYEFSLIIINSPLNDEFGKDLAIFLAENYDCGIVFICKQELFTEMSDILSPHGIGMVLNPLNKIVFEQAVKLSLATYNRLLSLRLENQKLQAKLEEIKIVNRAKFVLMQYLKLTEPQAHRYIEKNAMDRRLSKFQVAENVLKTYEMT